MNYTIRPEKTAITNKFSKSLKVLEDLDKNLSILDFGAGKLRNSKKILNMGYKNVSILETEEQLKNISSEDLSLFNNVYKSSLLEEIDKHDIIVCNYVLNVIPEKEVRDKIIKKIKEMANIYVLIEVRHDSNIKRAKTKIPYKDGFLMGKGSVKTFQKPFKESEITDKFKKFEIIHKKRTPDGFYILFKKET